MAIRGILSRDSALGEKVLLGEQSVSSALRVMKRKNSSMNMPTEGNSEFETNESLPSGYRPSIGNKVPDYALPLSQWKIKPHSLNVSPFMSKADYDALEQSVKEIGQKRRILLYEGKILDGKMLYLACLNANLKPKVKIFQGTEQEALDLHMSLNFTRASFTKSQRALIAVSSEPPSPQWTTEQTSRVALESGVSRPYIYLSRNLLQQGPELVDLVKSGQLSLPAAKAKVLKEKRNKE